MNQNINNHQELITLNNNVNEFYKTGKHKDAGNNIRQIAYYIVKQYVVEYAPHLNLLDSEKEKLLSLKDKEYLPKKDFSYLNEMIEFGNKCNHEEDYKPSQKETYDNLRIAFKEEEIFLNVFKTPSKKEIPKDCIKNYKKDSEVAKLKQYRCVSGVEAHTSKNVKWYSVTFEVDNKLYPYFFKDQILVNAKDVKCKKVNQENNYTHFFFNGTEKHLESLNKWLAYFDDLNYMSQDEFNRLLRQRKEQELKKKVEEEERAKIARVKHEEEEKEKAILNKKIKNKKRTHALLILIVLMILSIFAYITVKPESNLATKINSIIYKNYEKYDLLAELNVEVYINDIYGEDISINKSKENRLIRKLNDNTSLFYNNGEIQIVENGIVSSKYPLEIKRKENEEGRLYDGDLVPITLPQDLKTDLKTYKIIVDPLTKEYPAKDMSLFINSKDKIDQDIINRILKTYETNANDRSSDKCDFVYTIKEIYFIKAKQSNGAKYKSKIMVIFDVHKHYKELIPYETEYRLVDLYNNPYVEDNLLKAEYTEENAFNYPIPIYDSKEDFFQTIENNYDIELVFEK